MTRIILGLAVILLASVCGNLYAEKFKRRKRFFIALESFAVHMKREISYASSPVGELIRAFHTDDPNLRRVLAAVESGSEDKELPTFLSGDEALLAESFLSRIGRSDRSNELELVSSFISEIRDARAAETARCAKVTALATKLGFFAGLMIFVIII